MTTESVSNETAQAFLRAVLAEQRAESAERAADMSRQNADGDWASVRDAWEDALLSWLHAYLLADADSAATTEHHDACQAGAGRARRGRRYALDMLMMGRDNVTTEANKAITRRVAAIRSAFDFGARTPDLGRADAKYSGSPALHSAACDGAGLFDDRAQYVDMVRTAMDFGSTDSDAVRFAYIVTAYRSGYDVDAASNESHLLPPYLCSLLTEWGIR